jgi:hypothetical protein
MGEPLWVVVRGGEDDEMVVQVSKATRVRLVTEQGDGGTAIVATFREEDDVELVSGLPLRRASTLLKVLRCFLAEGDVSMLEFVNGPKTGTIYLREQDAEKVDRVAEREDDKFDRERESESDSESEHTSEAEERDLEDELRLASLIENEDRKKPQKPASRGKKKEKKSSRRKKSKR